MAVHIGHFVYLLKLREHVNSNEDVFKIGFSRQFADRMRAYPKGSMVLCTWRVQNGPTAEATIKSTLAKHFKSRDDLGSEYYEGDPQLMIHVFTSCLLGGAHFCTSSPSIAPAQVTPQQDPAPVKTLDIEQETSVVPNPVLTPTTSEVVPDHPQPAAPKRTSPDLFQDISVFMSQVSGELRQGKVNAVHLYDLYCDQCNIEGSLLTPSKFSTFVKTVCRVCNVKYMLPVGENAPVFTFPEVKEVVKVTADLTQPAEVLPLEYNFMQDLILGCQSQPQDGGTTPQSTQAWQLDDLYDAFKQWLTRKGPSHGWYTTSLLKFGHKMTKLISKGPTDTMGFKSVTKARKAAGIIYTIDVPGFIGEMLAKRWIMPSDLS